MFGRLVEDIKESINASLRLASLAILSVLALLIALIFLGAAAFIYLAERYGAIQACLAAAGLFLVLTLIGAAWFAIQKRRKRIEAARRAKAAARAKSVLGDPALLAAGLQAARAVGLKKFLPILALGGLILGVVAGRMNSRSEAPAE